MSAEEQVAGETLDDLLTELTGDAETTQQPETEEWDTTIARIHVAGRIHEITEQTWFYFLEVLPPKLHGGRWFAFAEGLDPLTIFWRRDGRYLCRKLTTTETKRVCELSGLPANYGM